MKGFTIPTIFKAIDKFTGPIMKMAKSVKTLVSGSDEEIARFQRRMQSLGDSALRVAKKSAVVGLAIAAPLVVAANSAIQFEDRMADIAKSTGLAGKELNDFGYQIMSLAPDTRTSIEELQQIAAIGGQMGVAQKELLSFTDSVNKFNVALGSDFSGGTEAATKAISGLRGLFKETRDIKIDEAITRAGSAINALSSKGINVPELTEFTSRIGRLPDAIKPSLQDVTALGAVFNKTGLSADVAARGLGDILIKASKNIPAFANQMGIATDEAARLINTNPTEFASKFAASLNGLNAQQLSKTLDKLNIGDAGTIGVVGALASSTKMLGEFQSIAHDEFKKGTSILSEYNTKNNTTAANLAKAKNNLEVIAITVGTQLLPVLNDLLKTATPIIKGFLQWAKDNSGTLKTVVGLTVGISALSFVVSGLSSVVWVGTSFMKIMATQIKGVTVAQHLWNVAMSANPIGAIIIAIVALIGLIAIVINKWNEWGAALSVFLGPLGLVISLIQSFRRNWDMITEAFTNGGIVEGIKAIGKTILDAVLMPIQQLVSLIGNLTGIKAIQNVANMLAIVRKGMGVNVTTDESGEPLQAKEAVNPEARREEAMIRHIETVKRYNSTLTINDTSGRAKLANENPGINLMPKSTSTMGWSVMGV